MSRRQTLHRLSHPASPSLSSIFLASSPCSLCGPHLCLWPPFKHKYKSISGPHGPSPDAKPAASTLSRPHPQGSLQGTAASGENSKAHSVWLLLLSPASSLITSHRMHRISLTPLKAAAPPHLRTCSPVSLKHSCHPDVTFSVWPPPPTLTHPARSTTAVVLERKHGYP